MSWTLTPALTQPPQLHQLPMCLDWGPDLQHNCARRLDPDPHPATGEGWAGRLGGEVDQGGNGDGPGKLRLGTCKYDTSTLNLGQRQGHGPSAGLMLGQEG